MPKLETRDFFYANVLIYKLSGITLYSPDDLVWYKKLLERTWSLLIYFPSTMYLVLEVIILHQTHDLQRFFNQTGIFLTHLLGIAKVMLLVWRHEKILEIQRNLQTDEFEYEECGEFRPKEIFAEAMKLSTTVTMTLYCMYSFVGGSALIATELMIDFNVKGDVLPENITCFDFMQYYFYIPWNSDTKNNCRLTNLFMSYCIACYAFIIASHDGVYAALLNCFKAQLNILCGAITTIRPRVYKRLKLPENFDIHLDTQNPMLERELYNEMKKFNRHLILLLEVSEGVEDIFTLMILMQTTSSIIIMASILFYATNIPITSPVFFSQCEYFICIFVQLTVFCWFGSGVTHSSEMIMDCLYNSNWYSASKRFKSSLITMMCRAQRPIYLTIGKFSPLTLSAIVTVTKASASYYAVFKSVGIEED